MAVIKIACKSFGRVLYFFKLIFPKPVFDALRAANDKLLDELAKKNPLSKEIIESRRHYLQKIRAWTNISDKAYLNS
jgi:TRAP-type mannitol/chloroaromatic compound transport system substrate-binding protein